VRILKHEVVLDLIHELARAAGMDGMVGGQSIDLEVEDQGVNLATVENIHQGIGQGQRLWRVSGFGLSNCR